MADNGHNQPTQGEVPEDANEHCPGTRSEAAGKSDACKGCPNQEVCATAPKGPDPDLVAIAERMATVKHKILVLSGKGGVGKSTFSAQLSFALAGMGLQVGLLDIDICGPSIPKMLGLEGQDIHQSSLGWSPIYLESNLGVMSVGFMLPHPDEAQFLKDVDWGELDYLVHISIAQYLLATGVDGAVVVTTPQEVALADVRKEISFCRKVGIRVLGVVENMSGLRQPLAGFRFVRPGDGADRAPELLALEGCAEVFAASRGGALGMCRDMHVPFLGKVPLDPQLCRAAEEGRSCFEDQRCAASAPAIREIVEKLLAAGDATQ
ncbi:unnamed protein product [Spirodela intermedia]|uniref:Uncharacterized protein n=1 Tax=Spirodela intermedia TaxID=51605 RepID=A0A7I8INX9_SPIIN|nr:unnamed protein product [Spirodela intermedia]CAA6659665.1 unnamed protein product [Spirodela intermedia]